MHKLVVILLLGLGSGVTCLYIIDWLPASGIFVIVALLATIVSLVAMLVRAGILGQNNQFPFARMRAQDDHDK